MRSKALLIGALFLLSSFALAVQEVKTLTLPSEGIVRLEINCGAGFLNVKGVEGLQSVEVKAEIYARGVDAGPQAAKAVELRVHLWQQGGVEP